MANSGAANGSHHIATKETKLRIGVNFFQRPHQV